MITEDGNRMPIDVEPIVTGNLLLAPAEVPPRVTVVSRTGRLPGMKLYVSHFKTCRFAGDHRTARGRKHKASRPPAAAPALFTEAPR
ncbi:MAG: hypothetical protein JO296_21255 [Pseudonocardiales bacterium]|nr:hypothetical protein [Pseudonocardiales bacterium]